MGLNPTLSAIEVPFFMEFAPAFYANREGEFELLMNELELHFDSYICAQCPEQGILPLRTLWNGQKSRIICDLFLFKQKKDKEPIQ